jgi:phosphoribosylformylglycinamidine (FGAM) synthase PurS component
MSDMRGGTACITIQNKNNIYDPLSDTVNNDLILNFMFRVEQ